jgi:hypothetical protein
MERVGGRANAIVVTAAYGFPTAQEPGIRGRMRSLREDELDTNAGCGHAASYTPPARGDDRPVDPFRGHGTIQSGQGYGLGLPTADIGCAADMPLRRNAVAA